MGLRLQSEARGLLYAGPLKVRPAGTFKVHFPRSDVLRLACLHHLRTRIASHERETGQQPHRT